MKESNIVDIIVFSNPQKIGNECTSHVHRLPLLKRLTEVGDPLAMQVFKEEIAKRFMSNHKQTIEFLFNEGYLDYLNYEELQIILENSNLNIRPFEDVFPYISSGQFDRSLRS